MATPKKFKPADVGRLFKDSYRQSFEWNVLLPGEVHEYLDLLEKSKGCPMTLTMGALLSLTASLSGTKTSLETKDGAFTTPLNTYTLCICDPGGGKSTTYDHVICPILERIEAEEGLRIALEQYTTAGMQRHQRESRGYGFITADEGARFLAHVNAKQLKNEGERGLLCKMWGGRATFRFSPIRSVASSSLP